MNTLTDNFLLDTDSYKASHWLQYPEGTTNIYSYIESRGGKYPVTVFFGLQYILERYFVGRVVTPEMVEEAKAFFEAHGEPFNYDGWMYIATVHDGHLPLRIKAVREGTVVPTHNVLVTAENTDPNCYWLTSWAETQLMRIWYPITVASQSWTIRQIILSYLDWTSDDPAGEIGFKLHDFGSRGVSSRESAGIGGMAHLVNFMGSDTVEGVRYANHYYNHPMAAFSIPAAEHSTTTIRGRENETETYRDILKQFGGKFPFVAVVSDSYDIFNACENIWGRELHAEVINSGSTLVIRPDSGDPATVVLRCIQILAERFGWTTNSKGYRVLNHVRVIQGDGINEDSIKDILDDVTGAGYSASNVTFGMGGALLQQVNRDTQKFAMKCSWAKVDGREIEVFKDPVTDSGKRSKRGRLDLYTDTKGTIWTGREAGSGWTDYPAHPSLVTVFEAGELKVRYTLDEVRERAKVVETR